MLGDFIKQQRIKNNASQEDLAIRLGISRPTYLKIENDERELTISEAQTLAGVFEISLEDLIATREPEYRVLIDLHEEKKSDEIQVRVQAKDFEKFKQVLLYILGKVGSKPNVGETVLNKLLYYIDFDYYERFEENLMGSTYIKNRYGPTSIDLKAIIDEMKRKDEIEEVKSQHFEHESAKYLPLISPNYELFSAQEITHIDWVLSRLSDRSAKYLTNLSHRDIPYLVAKDGEQLSYESVFYRTEDQSVRSYEDEL